MEIKLNSIGTYHSDRKNPYSLPRQPEHDTTVEFSSEPGVIQLHESNNFQQALTGLEGFSHLWVVYLFHHNQSWKPMTLPPRGTENKIGVFATRSPYRPNPIGMSCLRIQKIEGLKIFVEGADLMDETPILDIKPYISYSDSIPDANMGWLHSIDAKKFSLTWQPLFLKKLEWLKTTAMGLEAEFASAGATSSALRLGSTQKNYILQLQDFIQRQLEFHPTDERRKRVHAEDDFFVLSYRTWRVKFRIISRDVDSKSENSSLASVEDLYSGYSDADLSDPLDPHQDKELHRLFQKIFVDKK